MSFTARSPFRARGPFRLRGPWRLVAGQPWGSAGSEGFFDGGKSFDLRKLTLAVLLASGVSNAVATTNPPGTVVLSDGTVGYGAHNYCWPSTPPTSDAGGWARPGGVPQVTNTLGQPDSVGGATAFRLTAGGQSESSWRYSGYTFAGSTTYTAAARVRLVAASGARWVYMRPLFTDNGGGATVWFDLQTGVVGTKNAPISTARVTALPDGWYLIEATGTTASSVTFSLCDWGVCSGDAVLTSVSGHAADFDVPTIARGSTAPYRVPTTTAASYAPRLTCDRGATHNYRTQSQNMIGLGWGLNNGATGTNGTADPNGGATAYTLNTGSGFLQAPAATVPGMGNGVLATESIWLKASAPVTITVNVADNADGAPFYSYSQAITTTWQRYSFLYTGTAASSSDTTIQINQHASAQVSVAFSQCNKGPVALPYVATTTAAAFASGTPTSQNLATGSGTQSITVVSGCVYSILHQTGGTYTLSGAATGTTTAGTATVFVATSNTLTLTASSAPTLLQVWEGTGSMPYTVGPFSQYPQKSLKREPTRTNTITYSEALDNAAWAKNGCTITANAAIDPAGQSNADALFETAVTGEHQVERADQTFSANTAYTLSAYVRPIGGRNCTLFWFTNSVNTVLSATFDITTGTIVTAATGSGSAPPTNVSASIVPAGAGYYRVSITGTTGATAGAGNARVHAASGSSFNYAGDITKGIYVWGVQLEAGARATTYIPTGASAVTRDADLIRPAAGFVTDGPQTIRVRFIPDQAASGANQAIVHRGGGYPLYLTPAGQGNIFDSVASVTGSVVSDGVASTAVARWSGAAMGVSVNGAAVASGSFDGTMGGGTLVEFGDIGAGASGFSGDIISIESAPIFASDAQMPQLSAGTLQ